MSYFSQVTVASGTINSDMRGYRSSDSTYQPLRLDRATNTIQTIEYEHHEIHSGSSFMSSYTVDLGNAGSADVILTTPNTTAWAHLSVGIQTESEAHAYMYENPTLGTAVAGTAIPSYNRDRNSAGTSTTQVKHSTTVTAVGTAIWEAHWGSGRGIGGGERAVNEVILKQNEDYLLRVINQTANANYIWVSLDWYEHTNIA